MTDIYGCKCIVCDKCGGDFEEKELSESHDVPCYIFPGADRKEKKQQADKYGRHYLCKKCHDIYEKIVFSVMVNEADSKTKKRMIVVAIQFAKRWFNEQKTN